MSLGRVLCTQKIVSSYSTVKIKNCKMKNDLIVVKINWIEICTAEECHHGYTHIIIQENFVTPKL